MSSGSSRTDRRSRDIEYREPTPSTFSFNSPLGACETCRGFGRTMGIDYGRTMGIDYGLVVPDESKTLREGAVRPWQSQSYRQCQRDLLRYAHRRGVALDRPWRALDAATRAQRRIIRHFQRVHWSP